MTWRDPRWKYIPSGETDILAAFRRLGWTPPSEARRQREAALRAVRYLTEKKDQPR